jgi:hypothetical protein
MCRDMLWVHEPRVKGSSLWKIHRVAQISSVILPGRLNFMRWRLICLGPQHGPCSMSVFWRLEFWGGSQIFGKFLHFLKMNNALLTLSDRSELRYSTTTHGVHIGCENTVSLLLQKEEISDRARYLETALWIPTFCVLRPYMYLNLNPFSDNVHRLSVVYN